jgi:hypothetical protein
MILKKVFDVIDLDLMQMCCYVKNFFITRKQLTKQKNKFTLQRKNTEIDNLGV